MAAFNGFGPPTLSFLSGLSQNNSKQWFDVHRADYENHFLTPAVRFIEAIGEPLRQMLPGVQAVPKVNGSIFRINRDVRFSKDKTPYKDHLDLWFWQGDRKTAVSSLFFRLTAERVILGAGAHMFPPPQIAAWRDALMNDKHAGELLEIGGDLAKAGIAIAGDRYAKPPKEFAGAAAGIAELSRFKALHAFFDEPHPASLGTPAFVDHCVKKFAVVAPVHRWLVNTTG